MYEDGSVNTSGSYGGVSISQDFDASKVDFTVENTGVVDKETPKLTSLKLLNPDPIYVGDEIQIEAGYSDDASGVKSIYLSFINGLGMDIELNEEGKKEGTAVLKGTAQDAGEYKIESVQIEDYAGQIRNYFTDDNGNVVDGSVESGGASVKCPTFEAKYFDKVLQIESVRLEKDGVVKNEFTAGDEFELVVEVKNNTGETYEIDANHCYVGWDNLITSLSLPEDTIVLKNQETKELPFTIKTNKYSGTKNAKLSEICISDGSGEKEALYQRMFYEEGGEERIDELFIYGGRPAKVEIDASQADFTVIGELEPDDVAPFIESISVKDAVVPGELIFNINLDKDRLGSAPLNEFGVSFIDVNNEKNNISFYGESDEENFSYDASTGVCTYTVELTEQTLTSEYTIGSIEIFDEAGNGRVYIRGEGEKLVESGDAIENPEFFDNIKFNITNTGNPSTDVDGPILTEFALVDKNLDNSKKVQYRLKVDDETGLSGMKLDFYIPEEERYDIIQSWDYEKDGDEYVFSFDLTECVNGSYELATLSLYDDSGRENETYYVYDREKQQFYLENGSEEPEYVSFKGNYDFKIQEHTHKWNTGIITIQPTCTTEGVRTYKCTYAGCTQTKTEPVEKLSHSYKWTVTASTCAKQGNTKYTCTGCGHSYSTPLPTVSHNYKASVTASTCVKQGNTKYTCTGCGHSYSKDLPLLNHSYTTTTTKATASKRNGSIVKKCRICGKVASKSTIYYPKTVKLSATSYTYNGKTKTPKVKVVGSNGKTISEANYKASYSSGRKNVGRYTVKVSFKGNYSGSISKTFDIEPKGTSVSKVSVGKKKAVVKWKKQTKQTTGYQIQYSTDKKFRKGNKTVTIKKNKTTSKTITKLKYKKKYYVRIRTYKKAKYGKKYVNVYSSWSKAKSVRAR